MSAIRRNSVQIQQHILFRGPKKGIQATDINELTDTKSKTVFFNLYISDLMRKDSGVKHINIMGKHIILMVCTDMYILFSNVMQRESR